MKRGELERAVPGIFDGQDEYVLHFSGVYDDIRGILETLLVAFFRAGLDLKMLRGSPAGENRVRFEVAAKPFRSRCAPKDVKQLVGTLRRHLKDELDQLDGKVRAKQTKLDKLRSTKEKEEKQQVRKYF